MSLLKVCNLTKTIANKTIVENINLTVDKGEIVGFLGPNGAGKTTTIKMIMGIMKITNGSVSICGYDTKDEYVNAMKCTGAIVENPDLYMNLSGMQNLQYFAGMYDGLTDDDVNQVIDLVKMTDRKNDKVKTYSLGMRQRIGLAQALLNKPKLIILDEPTNGLDPIGISELRTLLKTIAKEHGTGVLISSHQLAEIEIMCDKVCIINNGKAVIERYISNANSKDTLHNICEYEFVTNNNDKVIEVLNKNNFEFVLKKNVITKVEPFNIDSIISKLQLNKVQIYAINQKVKTLEEEFIQITRNANPQIQ